MKDDFVHEKYGHTRRPIDMDPQNYCIASQNNKLMQCKQMSACPRYTVLQTRSVVYSS